LKLVVDTNILFSFFKKESFTRKLIIDSSLELISPELALKEIQKYSKELLIKSKINKEDFDYTLLLLKEHVKFFSLQTYKNEFSSSLKIAETFSQKDVEEYLDDIDFFALASKERCHIWSNDTLFKKQSIITVFNTTELVKHFRLKKL
jgi:predicted nucleic acid-binding protein